MNNNSDLRKINKKFKFDEKEIIAINQLRVSERSEEEDDSFQENLSQDESNNDCDKNSLSSRS